MKSLGIKTITLLFFTFFHFTSYGNLSVRPIAGLSKHQEINAAQTVHLDTSSTPLAEKKQSYYYEPGSYASKREPYPPDYVIAKKLSGKSQVTSGFIHYGLDFRSRFEFRNNDIRQQESINRDLPILTRSRLFFGFSEMAGALGGAIEFQDANSLNSQYDKTGNTRDFNRIEPIQFHVSLKFKSLLGKDKGNNPRNLAVKVGRMHFEFLDRRLISSNPWRNTTNTFRGTTIGIGNDENLWSLDVLAVQPLSRLIYHLDTVNRKVAFGGMIFHWRKWSPAITIEPFYLRLIQGQSPSYSTVIKNVATYGLRAYGWLMSSKLNYDFVVTKQGGDDNRQKVAAYAITAEIGYTIRSSKSKYRISLFYGEASGDKNPSDGMNNRFDRLFGFSRPWNADDYIQMENIKAPKVRIEADLKSKLQIDAGYGLYWLQSSTDRLPLLFNDTFKNRDKSGLSGTNVGSGFDIRARYKISDSIKINTGYSKFYTGNFIINLQNAQNNEHSKSSDFYYLELSVNVASLLNSLK
jgi:hypothetical protein